MPWNFRAFGSAEDPVRQSALGAFASQNGCARRYKYERDAEADGELTHRDRWPWRSVMGTAVHAVIERGLTKRVDLILAGKLPAREHVLNALDQELARATRTAAELKDNPDAPGDAARIDWQDANPVLEKSEGVSMVRGALHTTAERACEIVAVEAPFRAELDGLHLEGTADLVYRPRANPEGIALADWKTGERHTPRVILDKGYQVSAYSFALEHGTLWPNDDARRVKLGQYPQSIHIVHLRDFVAYDRAVAMLATLREHGPATSVELCERLPRFQLNPRSVAGLLNALSDEGLITKGKRKQATLWGASASQSGPSTKTIWYESQRSSEDVARFRVSLKTIVGTARMGRFVESMGEQCDRCPFQQQCLGAGYGPSKTEAKKIEDLLAGMDLSVLDGDSATEAA